jgi:hypothetical protein
MSVSGSLEKSISGNYRGVTSWLREQDTLAKSRFDAYTMCN